MIVVAHVPRHKKTKRRVFIVTTKRDAKKTLEQIKRCKIDSERYPTAEVNVICDITDKDDLEQFLMYAQYFFGFSYQGVTENAEIGMLVWDKMKNNFDLIPHIDAEEGWAPLQKKYPWVQDALDAMSTAGKLLAQKQLKG